MDKFLPNTSEEKFKISLARVWMRIGLNPYPPSAMRPHKSKVDWTKTNYRPSYSAD